MVFVFLISLVSKASDHKYRYLKNLMEWVERTIFYPIKSFDVRVMVEIEGSVEAFDTEVCCQDCNVRDRATDIISVVANFPWERIHSVKIVS